MVALGAGSAPDLLERIGRAKFSGLVSVDGSQAEARLLALRARKLGLELRVWGDAGLAVECKAALLMGGDALGLAAALRDAGVVCGACPSGDQLRGGARSPLRAMVVCVKPIAIRSRRKMLRISSMSSTSKSLTSAGLTNSAPRVGCAPISQTRILESLASMGGLSNVGPHLLCCSGVLQNASLG